MRVSREAVRKRGLQGWKCMAFTHEMCAYNTFWRINVIRCARVCVCVCVCVCLCLCEEIGIIPFHSLVCERRDLYILMAPFMSSMIRIITSAICVMGQQHNFRARHSTRVWESVCMCCNFRLLCLCLCSASSDICMYVCVYVCMCVCMYNVCEITIT